MTRQPEPGSTVHDQHDHLLVAAYATDDLVGAARVDGEELVSRCADCARLASDVQAIVAATRAIAAIPRSLPAGRSFTLTPDRAAELGRGRWWRRVLRPFASATAPLRPAAGVLATLGIAGLLLATIPAMPFGAALSGGGRTDTPAEYAGPTNGSDTQSGGGPVAPTSGGKGSFATPGTEGIDTDTSRDVVAPTAVGPSPLVLLSSSLLAIGIALLVLRAAARRLT